MNAEWREWIGGPENRPQRACVQAALAPGSLAETATLSASSTGPVTETDTPPDPETPSPPEPETPAPPDPETPEPETPTEPETTEPTAPEFAVALTGAVRGSAGKVAVSGAMTNAGTTASAPTRIRSLNGRRRVHTATVPAIDGGGVHAISADVAMPEGSAVQVCLVPKGRNADPSNGLRRASP